MLVDEGKVLGVASGAVGVGGLGSLGAKFLVGHFISWGGLRKFIIIQIKGQQSDIQE